MTENRKRDLGFQEIKQRLDEVALPDVDLVVGIHSGGKVAAALIAWKLDRPLTMIHINYRDETNTPRYDAPKLLADPFFPPDCQRILLVDDVAVSGKTLELAKTQLPADEVTTLVLKGREGSADIVVFTEIPTCVNWPWN
ncbi:MAG: phosphoribosyltransferase [Gammaproteobacteria bacterium]|nr:phosphoribosyltransferase [Gammaproteobacteria bacterium]